MAEYPGKRAAGVLGISKGGSGLGIRDKKHEDRTVHRCNRIGCSTRLNSMKETQVVNRERAKYSRPSFRSMSSKVGSSCNPFLGASDLRKSRAEHQNPKFLKDTFLANSSSRQEETEVSELTPEHKDVESAVINGSCVNTIEEVVSYTLASSTRPQKQIHQRSGLGNQNTSLGSSVRRSFPPRNTSVTVKPALQGQGAIAQRYSLRNLSCTLISDVLPSGCSSSDSDCDRMADGQKKRFSNGEGSSRSKSISGLSTAAKSGMQRNVMCNPNLSFSDRPLPQTRRTRNFMASRDGISSVRTRRVINGDTRTRLSNDGNDNHRSFHEPVGQLGNDHETARSRPIVHLQNGSNRPFNSLSVNQDVYRRFEEIVLALERIGQDGELAIEQLLDVESNLLLAFHDQHRAMRLDIDNMSYEELLALEEKMGTVSTALSEEALSICLKKSCYISLPPVSGSAVHRNDDTKCTICQEEYVLGDEVGKLGCDHRYHVVCIHQWLRLKNWCPVCKSSVSAS